VWGAFSLAPSSESRLLVAVVTGIVLRAACVPEGRLLRLSLMNSWAFSRLSPIYPIRLTCRLQYHCFGLGKCSSSASVDAVRPINIFGIGLESD